MSRPRGWWHRLLARRDGVQPAYPAPVDWQEREQAAARWRLLNQSRHGHDWTKSPTNGKDFGS